MTQRYNFTSCQPVLSIVMTCDVEDEEEDEKKVISD